MSNVDILGLGSAIVETERLANKASEIQTYELDGQEYTDRQLYPIKPFDDRKLFKNPKRDHQNIYSLRSLIENIHAEDLERIQLPIRMFVSEQSVNVYSDLDEIKDRELLYVVEANNPKLTFNRYMSVEEMIIQLQTGFMENDNRTNLIAMISKLKKDNTVEMSDDGVTQTVKLQSGVTSTSEVKIPPLVDLIPIRTFFEVEQPLQRFLIRINESGEVALFDAGGGVWQNDCQLAITKYLKSEFNDYVEDGTVVIG